MKAESLLYHSKERKWQNRSFRHTIGMINFKVGGLFFDSGVSKGVPTTKMLKAVSNFFNRCIGPFLRRFQERTNNGTRIRRAEADVPRATSTKKQKFCLLAYLIFFFCRIEGNLGSGIKVRTYLKKENTKEPVSDSLATRKCFKK